MCREKNFRLLYRSCVSRAYFQRISFLTFVVVVLFFVEADNMHDDVSTYFVLVYRRREPVLVMKRNARPCFGHLGNLKVSQTRFRLNFLFCVFVFF